MPFPAAKNWGTLDGFGSVITGFTTITEDAGANWKLTGSITGTGAIDFGANARLTLGGTVSIASIAFGTGGQGSLHLNNPCELTSVFSDFRSGDSIFLASLQAASLSFQGGVLTLFDASHAVLDTLRRHGGGVHRRSADAGRFRAGQAAIFPPMALSPRRGEQ